VYIRGATRVSASRAAASPAIAAMGSSAITLPNRVITASAYGAFTGVSPLRASAICASVTNCTSTAVSTTKNSQRRGRRAWYHSS
jgi:hypothetical protein